MKITRHHALVLGAMLAFSLMAFFTRHAGASPLGVAAWRALVVALVYGGWAVLSSPARWGALRADRVTLRHGIIYGVALAVASSTYVGGYAFTTVANTVFLHNLAPAAAFPLAWWVFRERPGAQALTGAVVAILGVGLLSGVSLFQFSHYASARFVMGDLLAIASGLAYAAVLVATRWTRQAETPVLPTLFVAWGVSAVLLMGLAAVFGALAISLETLLWVIGLAVICTNLPFYLLNLGMKRVNAGLASVLSMSEVLFATVLGWLAFGEVMAPLGWIGGLLVVAGVIYALYEAGDAPAEPVAGTSALSQRTTSIRWARLGIWLVALNAGAFLAVLGGAEAGALLAWMALAGLLLVGQGPLRSLVAPRHHGVLRWTIMAAAGAIALGLALRGGWGGGSSSGLVGLVSLVVLVLDARLAAVEEEPERDRNRLLQAGLLVLASASAFGFMEHGAARLLTPLAALLAGVALWMLALDALAGRTPWNAPTGESFTARSSLHVERFLSPGWIGVAMAIAWLAGAFHVVPVGSQAVVEVFGQPRVPASPPGLLVRPPPPVARVTLVDMTTVRRVVLADLDTPLLCGDQSMVSAQAVLHYRVSDAIAWLFGSSRPEDQLATLGRASLVETVGRLSQDDVLTVGRATVEERVLDKTQSLAASLGLGLEVLEVHLATVTVPAPVSASFLDVISADEEKRTRINLAEAYAAKVMPEVFGEARARVQRAEGQALRAVARAEGEAAHMRASLAGEAIDPTTTRLRLSLEATERSLDGTDLVLVPPGRRVWMGGDERGEVPRAEPAAGQARGEHR